MTLETKEQIRYILIIIFFLILGYGLINFYLETQGSNYDKARWCESMGYGVDNEISFLFDMSCYKIEEGIKKGYFIMESATRVGERYDYTHKYYLVERGL